MRRSAFFSVGAGALLASTLASGGLIARKVEDEVQHPDKVKEPESEAERPPLKSSGLPGRRTVEEAMAQTGTTSPAAALRVLKRTESSRMGYIAHVGAKQKAKALKAAEKAARKVSAP